MFIRKPSNFCESKSLYYIIYSVKKAWFPLADTQLMQLSIAMESKVITEIPYKEKKSLVVILCFMFTSALAARRRCDKQKIIC